MQAISTLTVTTLSHIVATASHPHRIFKVKASMFRSDIPSGSLIPEHISVHTLAPVVLGIDFCSSGPISVMSYGNNDTFSWHGSFVSLVLLSFSLPVPVGQKLGRRKAR